jgi:hypothetical protein
MRVPALGRRVPALGRRVPALGRRGVANDAAARPNGPAPIEGTPISHTGIVIPRAYSDGFWPPVDPSVVVDATGWLEQPAGWPALLCLGDYSVRRIGGPWADRQLIMDGLAT